MGNLYLALSGIIILIVSSLSPAKYVTNRLRTNVVLGLDTLTSIRLLPDTIRSEEISSVEQKNRQLYSQLAQCQKDVLFATTSGSLRPALTTHSQVTSVLSYSGGRWIVLSGTNDHLRVGDVVLMDSVFLGTLTRVTSTYGEIDIVGATSLPLLVQHEKSKAVAVLRREKDEMNAQFSKKINEIAKDDLFLTVPDGVHAHNSYPLASVDEVKSGNSDSMTLVRVRPIAVPEIGSTVNILLSQE